MYDASEVMISNLASCNFFWCVLTVPEKNEHNHNQWLKKEKNSNEHIKTPNIIIQIFLKQTFPCTNFKTPKLYLYL
jgi:hypothetical protein